MLVELHILQNFAPACLNRDDTNSPKDCEFGGYHRARISSQCIKKSMRDSEYFRNAVGEHLGTRSKRFLKEIRDRLLEKGISDDDINGVIEAFFEKLYDKFEGRNKELTRVALHLSPREIELITDAIEANWDKLRKSQKNIDNIAKELEKEIKDAKACDIALFGRMLADKPKKNIDAAAQVAHAFSTNRVNMEMDFFTAVDDLLPTGETGAGMMGIVEFNSSCFYRYANVDLGQLMFNLRNDSELAGKTLKGFLEADVKAVPSGKQNSMAAHNPPSLIFTVVRDNGFKCSLANAFVKPVYPGNDGDLIERSATALDAYWGELQKAYGNDGIRASAVCGIGVDKLVNLEDYRVESIDSLLEKVISAAVFEEQKLEG